MSRRDPLRVAMTLAVNEHEDAERLETHLRYHLARGLDLVVAGRGPVLDRFAAEGRVTTVAEQEAGQPLDEHLAAVAVAERGAEWVLPGRTGELWWPETGSLAAVLGALPDRISALEVSVLEFLRPSDGVEGEGPLSDRMLVRRAAQWPPRPPVRRAQRAGAPGSILRAARGSAGEPLPERGVLTASEWRPITVLGLPGPGGYARPFEPSEQLEAGIRDGRLIVDRRLQRFLSALPPVPDPTPTEPPDSPAPPREAMLAGRLEVAELRADALQALHARHEERLEKLASRLEKSERRERRLEARLKTLEGRGSAPVRALGALRSYLGRR